MFQSQGAITEKLRSFSMHDLTTIQGDEPVGQRPYQTLPETKKKTRASANESAGKYLSEIKNLCFVSKNRKGFLNIKTELMSVRSTAALTSRAPPAEIFSELLTVQSHHTHFSSLC